LELLRFLPRGQPDLYFFRHGRGIKGVTAGERFGEKYLYKWWVKACGNIGIEGVDLYGGTRHSTGRELRKYRTPEEIRLGSMHSTNKVLIDIFRLKRMICTIFTETRGAWLNKEFTWNEIECMLGIRKESLHIMPFGVKHFC